MGTIESWTACLAASALFACSPAAQVPQAAVTTAGTGALTLWSGAGDWATVSPDAGFAAFVDWDTGNLAARDLKTDSIWSITHKPGWDRDRSWAEGPLVFSPGGERIAYSYANASAGNPYRYELRVKRMDDTLEQVLDSVPSDAPGLTVLDWHGEAGILYGNLYADESAELRILSADGGAPRILKRTHPGGPAPHSGLFTPDGKTVLYLLGNTLRATTSQGTDDRSLDLDVETLLGWTGSGALVYNGRRGDVTGNFRVRMAGGALIDEPVLVQRTSRHVRPAGHADGTIYYLESVQVPRILLANVDLTSGKTVSAARPLTSIADGIAANPAWSPDGSRLAYTLKGSNRPVFKVVIADEHGGTHELASVDAGLITGLDWSSDGNSLVIAARTGSRESSWVGRIDVATGRIDRLVMHPALAIAAGPQGKVAYVRAALHDDSTARIMLLEAGRTAPREIVSFPVGRSPRSISVSPDGDSVAIIKIADDRSAFEIELIPVDGGTARTVARVERPARLEINLGSIPWTGDRRHLLVLARDQGKNLFVSVDVASGRIVPLELTLGTGAPRLHPAIHPDGRRILYVGGEHREDLKALRAPGSGLVGGAVE